MSRIRRGEKRKPHTESWKRALSERLRGKGNRFFGVPFFLGKKHSKITKNKISEKNSRIYKLQNPQGDIITIKNLKEFCKKNSLNNSLMVAVSKGRRKTHKGWRAEKLTSKGGSV